MAEKQQFTNRLDQSYHSHLCYPIKQLSPFSSLKEHTGSFGEHATPYLCCHPSSYLHPFNLCRRFDQPKVLHQMSDTLDVVFVPSFHLSQGLHVVRVQLCMHWFRKVIPNNVWLTWNTKHKLTQRKENVEMSSPYRTNSLLLNQTCCYIWDINFLCICIYRPYKHFNCHRIWQCHMSQDSSESGNLQTISHLVPHPCFVTFQLGHQVPEFLDGVSFIYSCESNCPICAWSGPIPQLSARISPRHKKYGFVGGQCFARNALQHQDAVRLLEPTEIQEVSVLVENVGDVIAHVVCGVG